MQCGEADAVEMIEVGGPSIARARKRRTRCRYGSAGPSKYEKRARRATGDGDLSQTCPAARSRRGGVRDDTRRVRSRDFARGSASRSVFPKTSSPLSTKCFDIAPGKENHTPTGERISRTRCALYISLSRGRAASMQGVVADHLLDRLRQVLLRGVSCRVRIIKTRILEGVGPGSRETMREAYERAACVRSVYAFGKNGGAVTGRSRWLGEALASDFVDVIFAPGLRRRGARVAAKERGDRIRPDRERRGSRVVRATSSGSSAGLVRTVTGSRRSGKGKSRSHAVEPARPPAGAISSSLARLQATSGSNG